eukprot:115074-Rhodomonas_salina.1
MRSYLIRKAWYMSTLCRYLACLIVTGSEAACLFVTVSEAAASGIGPETQNDHHCASWLPTGRVPS